MSGMIERVIVTIDAASENRRAIDTAARLAARTKAPLHAVFIEDEELLHLAGLPFARQVTLGAAAEPVTAETLELQLRAAAERAREQVLAAATRHRVESSFEVVRGASETAVSSASERDLVVASATTRPVAGHFRVECRWWSSIEAASGPFLLARHAWRAGGGVVTLLRECGEPAARLLAAAAEIAEARNSTLTVICPAAIAGSKDFEKWIAAQLAQHSVRLQIEVAPGEPAALQRRIGELNCQLLAVESGLENGAGARVRELVERFACDILVVR